MTAIDHQQPKVEGALSAMEEATGYDWHNEPATVAITQQVVAAAAPHLRAGMADELLDDTPGSPLTRGYQRLMDPEPGEHPVRTWEAAVRVMLDTLLEGGGE